MNADRWIAEVAMSDIEGEDTLGSMWRKPVIRCTKWLGRVRIFYKWEWEAVMDEDSYTSTHLIGP